MPLSGRQKASNKETLVEMSLISRQGRRFLGEIKSKRRLGRGRVRVLVDLGARRFDPEGIRDRKLVEQGTHGAQDSGSEDVLILRGERRHEANVHNAAPRLE